VLYTLSRTAARDLANIVHDLLWDEEHGGVEAARRVDEILDEWLRRITAGHVLGHRRKDMPKSCKLLFVVADPTQCVIALDPHTREIVRIVYGRREFPALTWE
jgi:plasmid stabilization system protein ParE